ncbi:MAG: cohesin domain-containing protein [Patescibacteria group bacterium]
MNKLWHPILNFITSLVLITSLSPTVFAAGNASMSLSPTSQNVGIGSNFAIRVSLNPNGENIDTARSVVQYSSDLVEAINFQLSGPLNNTSPGNYLNNNGVLSGGGFSITGGVNSVTTFATITFRAKAKGQARVALSPASRAISGGVEKINTGSLNSVIVNIGDAQVVPTSPSGQKLTIISPTHPSSDSWFSQQHAAFTWNEVGSNYKWSFDTNPDGIGKKATTEREVNIPKLKDGIFYFHLTTKLSDTETITLHYPIQNDKTAPRRFEPFLEVGDDNQLALRFSTTDATSGIGRYELQVNDGIFVETISPTDLKGLIKGENTVIVRAFDLAQNFREGWIEFFVNEDGTIREIAKSKATCSLGGLPLQLTWCCDYPAFCQYGIWVILALILLLILVIKNRKKRSET